MEDGLMYLIMQSPIDIPSYGNLDNILKDLTDLPADKRNSLTTSLVSKNIYLNKFGEVFK